MRRSLFPSRSEAQDAIAQGLVEVGGIPEPKAATRVDEQVPIKIKGPARRFVSRGGDKLAAALEAFEVAVTGSRCVDVGASTGGFTDCLLQRGAAEVVAVDVGYGQLHWKLRQEDRVTVVERTNIRHTSGAELGGPFDLVVADLSFISLCTVADRLAELAGPSGEVVALVKPQFEAGKGQVGKGGIVRDAATHRQVLHRVVECLAAAGIGACGVIRSPITGAAGNIEFLLWAKPGAGEMAEDEIEAVTR